LAASRAETSGESNEKRAEAEGEAEGEGRRVEDPRVRVMCVGRDARINNSRVISRIIIRYIGAYIDARSPSPFLKKRWRALLT
jgi:hypothetical protein